MDELLTGRENLRLMADLGHLDRRRAEGVIEHLLERFDLVDAADRRATTYSGGMNRRRLLADVWVDGGGPAEVDRVVERAGDLAEALDDCGGAVGVPDGVQVGRPGVLVDGEQ